MEDEIKEILDNVKKCCEIMKDENFVVYQKQDIIKLLDYITNLQEENQHLQEVLDYEEDFNRYLKSRNEKAIEYLEYQISQLDFYEDTKAKMLGSMVLVLLQGEDNNKGELIQDIHGDNVFIDYE